MTGENRTGIGSYTTDQTENQNGIPRAKAVPLQADLPGQERGNSQVSRPHDNKVPSALILTLNLEPEVTSGDPIRDPSFVLSLFVCKENNSDDHSAVSFRFLQPFSNALCRTHKNTFILWNETVSDSGIRRWPIKIFELNHASFVLGPSWRRCVVSLPQYRTIRNDINFS